jgi:hypothetical protein
MKYLKFYRGPLTQVWGAPPAGVVPPFPISAIKVKISGSPTFGFPDATGSPPDILIHCFFPRGYSAGSFQPGFLVPEGNPEMTGS